LFAGGVAFATPDRNDVGQPAPEGTLFKLYPDADKDWLKWQPQISIHPPDESAEPGAATGRLKAVSEAIMAPPAKSEPDGR
jgi:hypothetical protein